ncbi:sensor histidine kinase [Cryptosporangium arvum]|uniref:histidine kinase n=1 Tax=Cryptosporangium arvum DSM 44712 TaxID=927661 RepID=A0A010ZLX7_9ACTN|nr:sensor histidine kinase [Cryptosporangium arvum]EXG79664.1 signal transduction histidine kinase [Cryptosporangium arvum DSM 44712]
MSRAFDALLAVVLTALSLAVAGQLGHVQPEAQPVDAIGYALTAIACLALVARRWFPAVTLAVTTATVSTYLIAGYPYGPVLIAVAIATYTVVLRYPVRRAVLISGAAMLVLLGHLVFSESLLPGLLPGSAWIVVPFAVGSAVKLNRQAAAAEAQRAADDERLRVAQEVHDVVGHGLAAITMQADIALHLLPTKPSQAEAALTAISATSREALDELRATLEILRDRAPLAGLARLDALTDRITASGTLVRTIVTGEVRPLPRAVDLVAYRIVQESLTNVLRHAGPATATVRVGYGPDSVRIEVADTGPGGPFTEGHGIAGMRERVTSVGGTLAVSGSDGFRVVAELPA